MKKENISYSSSMLHTSHPKITNKHAHSKYHISKPLKKFHFKTINLKLILSKFSNQSVKMIIFFYNFMKVL